MKQPGLFLWLSAAMVFTHTAAGQSQLQDRQITEQGCIKVHNSTITVDLWDAGVEDNDTVTLYLNGNLILEKQRISKAVKTYTFNIIPGQNQLVLYANNLGDIPDNTAAFRVNGSEKKSLSSNLKTSGSMNIIFDAVGSGMQSIPCDTKTADNNNDDEAKLIRSNPQWNAPGASLFLTGVRRIETESYRKVELQGCYNVTQDHADLILWDCGVEDNDTVSIYLNGKWIIENYRLTKAKKSFPVQLQPGENYLVMYAHNLGDIPNNTAALGVSQQYTKEDVGMLASDKNTCAAFRIINGIASSDAYTAQPCIEKPGVDSTKEAEIVSLNKNKHQMNKTSNYYQPSYNPSNQQNYNNNPGVIIAPVPVYVPSRNSGGSNNPGTSQPAPQRQGSGTPQTPTRNQPKKVEY